jgi:hypothetical protein
VVAASPALCINERVEPVSGADDDRVEDANAEELSRLPKATADLDVLWARFDRAARMIVLCDAAIYVQLAKLRLGKGRLGRVWRAGFFTY